MTRTMTEALQTARLREDALAFISAGTPQPAMPQLPVSTATPQNDAGTVQMASAVPEQPEATTTPRKPFQDGAAAFPGLIGPGSMTFRLPPEIPGGLIRASADRKLRRERPFSQQEIVAEALRAWLAKEGYLPWTGDEVQKSAATQSPELLTWYRRFCAISGHSS